MSGCEVTTIKANFSSSWSGNVSPSPSPSASPDILASPPVLSSNVPVEGPYTSHLQITLTGTGLTLNSTIYVGTIPCTVDVVLSTPPLSLVCLTDIGDSFSQKGLVPIILTRNEDGQSTIKLNTFNLLDPPPSITSVTPTTGLSTGGDTITVVGTHFKIPAFAGDTGTLILVDGFTCKDTTYLSSTTITCKTFPHIPGTVSVSVINPDRQTPPSGGPTFSFVYTGATPVLDSLAPNIGGSDTRITLLGSNLLPSTGATTGVTGVTGVSFYTTSPATDGQPCTSLVIGPNNSSLSCLTPPSQPGTKNVQVINIDGQTTSALTYTYQFTGTSLAAGGSHSCGIINGKAACWGANDVGQLGINSTTPSATPTFPPAIVGSVQQISTGAQHTCSIINGGAVCWGKGTNGQLGNSSTSTSNALVPVQVVGLTSGVQYISATDSSSCAVVAGEVKCWGLNNYGQLGNNTTNQANTPVSVSGLTSGASQVAVGPQSTCAIINGGVKCWGENSLGSLGSGDTNSSYTPKNVSGLTAGVTEIGVGLQYACAVVNGGVKCWGRNDSGQLGNSSTVNSLTPVTVTGLTAQVQKLSVGNKHACAIQNGQVYCWGNNDSSQLGSLGGSNQSISQPVSVAFLGPTATSVSAGGSHTCAIANQGFRCWGSNASGQLGEGGVVTGSTYSAQIVTGSNQGISGLVSGASSNCALVNGGVKCWGDNASNKLGLGSSVTNTSVQIPQFVSGLTSGVQAVSIGTNHACALVSGQVQCWGSNTSGKIGQGNSTTNSSVPLTITGTSLNAQSLLTGYSFSCMLSNGSVKCWGGNNKGQLGNNDSSLTSSAVPVDLRWESDPTSTALNTDVSAIALGAYHACALKQGNVYCWGDNTYGQIGTSTATPYSIYARQVATISNATALIAGDNHTCALIRDRIKCWGYNGNGQLGNNTQTDSSSPVDVLDLASGTALVNVLKIVAGANHNCAKAVSGYVLCWGDNTKGQAGIDPNSTTVQRAPSSSSPILTTGAVTINAQEMAAGANHSCALSNSIAYCWGDNSLNQFGNATSTPSESYQAIDLKGI